MLGAFAVNTWVAIFAATGVILSAAYALYAYRRVVFGDLVKPALQTIKDLSPREIAILAPLVVVTILMGIYPKPIFDVTSASVDNLISDYKTALAIDHAPKLAARLQGVVK
jgi:NADH-quinone oxidoreductase subunit M